MRTGEDPDNPGQVLQVMPWPVYQAMTDHDLRAVLRLCRRSRRSTPTPAASRARTTSPVSRRGRALGPSPPAPTLGGSRLRRIHGDAADQVVDDQSALKSGRGLASASVRIRSAPARPAHPPPAPRRHRPSDRRPRTSAPDPGRARPLRRAACRPPACGTRSAPILRQNRIRMMRTVEEPIDPAARGADAIDDVRVRLGDEGLAHEPRPMPDWLEMITTGQPARLSSRTASTVNGNIASRSSRSR